ncbi:hypothetical protein ACFV4P_28080 [Kitasatospora sp. NPDC059795]|uniref:hypothetical protein n=1 Tax=Kitasatospora sp. NPDC059795 TaxID=3346949 RepID=UPI0036645B96
MPVTYITVNTRSELFAPAVRAFGNIAIVGRAGFGTPTPDPVRFTSPVTAAEKLKSLGGTTLTAKASKGDKTATAAAKVPAPVLVRFTDATQPGHVQSEVRTVTAATATSTGNSPTFGLTLDSALSADYSAGTKVTQESDSELTSAIRTAFAQTPPPTVVWGVPLVPDSPKWEDGLTAVDKLDVQIVLLARTPLTSDNSDTLTKLKNHVTADLGDGKERIGVAMLDQGVKTEDLSKLVVAPLIDERMVLIAHKSPNDVAAALAGVIAGCEPHISLLLKPISVAMPDVFSDNEIDAFDQVGVNWITRPVLLPGQALYLGEGYTSDWSHEKKYIDIVRVLDDINFRIKAALIPAIGNVRLSRVGLRTVETVVQAVLSPLVARQVIDGFGVVVPLLTLMDKDPADLTTVEAQEITTARANRSVDMTVEVVYAGAIHRLTIDLVLKG